MQRVVTLLLCNYINKINIIRVYYQFGYTNIPLNFCFMRMLILLLLSSESPVSCTIACDMNDFIFVVLAVLFKSKDKRSD